MPLGIALHKRQEIYTHFIHTQHILHWKWLQYIREYTRDSELLAEDQLVHVRIYLIGHVSQVE